MIEAVSLDRPCKAASCLYRLHQPRHCHGRHHQYSHDHIDQRDQHQDSQHHVYTGCTAAVLVRVGLCISLAPFAARNMPLDGELLPPIVLSSSSSWTVHYYPEHVGQQLDDALQTHSKAVAPAPPPRAADNLADTQIACEPPQRKCMHIV